MKKIYVRPIAKVSEYECDNLLDLGSGGNQHPGGTGHGGGDDTRLPSGGDDYAKGFSLFAIDDIEDDYEDYDY